MQEPNLDQLRRICQILGLSPSYLLSLEDAPETAEDMRFLQGVKKLYEDLYLK